MTDLYDLFIAVLAVILTFYLSYHFPPREKN